MSTGFRPTDGGAGSQAAVVGVRAQVISYLTGGWVVPKQDGCGP